MNWKHRETLENIAKEAEQKAASIEGANSVSAGIKDLYRLIAELAEVSRKGIESQDHGPFGN